MRKHNGMRPQDVVILLKIIAKGDTPWQNRDLALELFISPAEVSESLNRSAIAGLLEPTKRKTVFRQSLMEFIEFGLHYVFPAVPGTMVTGLCTAHSHPLMRDYFKTDLHYVWQDPNADSRGLSIQPLYANQVVAALKDETLYLMLALLDVFRVGRAREILVARNELRKIIL